jgi:hypothetical protein
MKTDSTIDIINRLSPVTEDTDRLAKLIDLPFPLWANQCHGVSLALLRTGEFGPGRIARGTCEHVPSQHSWIVLGNDCYNPNAVVVDPTLWAHDPEVTGIYIGRNRQGCYHQPHGAGSCFSVNPPQHHGGPDIELTPSEPLKPRALAWLGVLGPLDFRGWMEVVHLPVEDWPAREILTAVADTPALGPVFFPIDILGMLTDRNPGGLYW